ncbi:cytochrome P450 72A397-like [Impatiens glandulifera]|uniref:cytochrome P450 72A397-like n=1 Tax=Impatiens glandulifera TaxID=253017 RepID=UPI001FB115D3|nr:cytochrome P450 72A397-like [Impatiens glandulifera]
MYELTDKGIYVVLALAVTVMVAVAGWWGWRTLEWMWLKPKRMEKHLRSQGIKGNPYRIFFGDFKDSAAMTKQNQTNPIAISDDIIPRLLPFIQKTINTYGKKTFMWFGYMPRVHIMEPKLVKEVMSKNFVYLKPKSNPFGRMLVGGLGIYEHDQWAKHRKIVNPAFRMEKIKVTHFFSIP